MMVMLNMIIMITIVMLLMFNMILLMMLNMLMMMTIAMMTILLMMLNMIMMMTIVMMTMINTSVLGAESWPWWLPFLSFTITARKGRSPTFCNIVWSPIFIMKISQILRLLRWPTTLIKYFNIDMGTFLETDCFWDSLSTKKTPYHTVVTLRNNNKLKMLNNNGWQYRQQEQYEYLRGGSP